MIIYFAIFSQTSDLAQRVKELSEIQSSIIRFESIKPSINQFEKCTKKLFEFDGEPEESCARTRPLSARVPRKIINLKFEDNQTVPKIRLSTTASKYAPCSLNVNPYTQLQDVNPDFIIQDIMGMRGYQYGTNPL